MPAANIVLGGAGTDRTLTITPAANQFGNATITVTVSDGARTADRTFILTVEPVNDAPSISSIGDQSVDEDTPTGTLVFSVADLESAPGTLVVTGVSSDTGIVPNENIALGGSGTNRTVIVTPAPNQQGTVTITLTVLDGTALSTESFLVTVGAVNDAPTISDVPNRATPGNFLSRCTSSGYPVKKEKKCISTEFTFQNIFYGLS